MPQTQNRRSESFLLVGYRNTPTMGRATVTRLDGPKRTQRALTGLAVCWGLAVISIFIPVAHFLLVPGFALLGIWLFVRRMRTGEIVTNMRAPCPDCGAQQTFETGSGWKLPKRVACSRCSRTLTARAAAQFEQATETDGATRRVSFQGGPSA